jgi:hypothetical protein
MVTTTPAHPAGAVVDPVGLGDFDVLHCAMSARVASSMFSSAMANRQSGLGELHRVGELTEALGQVSGPPATGSLGFLRGLGDGCGKV